MNWLKAAAPYAALLLVSLLPFYIFFAGSTLPGGDDTVCHLEELADLAYGFEHGFAGISLTHKLLGSTGVSIYGFYGPFPHYFVVILYECFKWMGATLISSLKFAIVLFSFLSLVAVYRLSLLVTKRKGVSFAIALFYNFLPYKMYCFLYRGAYSEGIAICLLPIIALSLYRILHDEGWKAAPFIVLVLASATLVLTHPSTALFAACFALVYLLFSIRVLIARFKDWRWSVSFAASILLVVGLVSPYVFTVFANERSLLYIMTESSVMGTYYSDIAEAIKTLSLTHMGFIDWDTMKYYTDTPEASIPKLIISIAVYLVSAVGALLVDSLFLQKKEQRWWRLLLEAGILFVPSAVSIVNAETWVSLSCLYCYLLVKESYGETDEGQWSRNPFKTMAKKPSFYYVVVSIIVLLLLLYVPGLWKALPSFFYNIQFPYRLYGLLSLFLALLLMLLYKAMPKKKALVSGLVAFSCLLFLFDWAPLNARLNGLMRENASWDEPTLEDVEAATQVGWMNEYLPKEYKKGSTYSSPYSNSLYYAIREYVNPVDEEGNPLEPKALPSGKEGYFDPVFLEGSGSCAITALNTPNATFALTVTSDSALIEIPQFYYDGYRITLNEASGKTSQASVLNVDGLVSYEAKRGSYTVSVAFLGPMSYRVGRVFFYLSFLGLAGLGSWSLVEKRRKRRAETPTEI